MQVAPTVLEHQVRWLVDRAEITDLLIAVARRADNREFDRIAELFTKDGYIVLPYGDGHLPASRIGDMCRKIFAGYARTHHLLGNFAIEIDGDSAVSHHYVLATHVPDADNPSAHADIGGWYDMDQRRTENGWRLHTLDLKFIYADNLRFQPGDPAEPAHA